MATNPERHSRVPSHLRQFLRPSLTTIPLDTQAPYSYSLPNRRSSASVELCPSHWRLRPKKSLRSKVKAVILKEWPASGSHRRASTSATLPNRRPGMMRMKDSDDYITARAANPRTGLISPSIGSPSPRTPDTPGDALDLAKPQPPSPTPGPRARPMLSRANEGRQISAGTLNTWRSDGKGWVSDTVLVAASPRETPVTAGAGLLAPQSHAVSRRKNDQFVVHMPSAREPQPYIYPGRSAAEIEAFEFYRKKARRTSGEGYGQRVPCGGRRASDGVRKVSAHGRRADCHAHPVPSARANPAISVYAPVRDITVMKRPTRKAVGHQLSNNMSTMAGAEIGPMMFAPFQSPRTPVRKHLDVEDTLLQTVKMPGAFQSLTPDDTPVHRKVVVSAVGQTDSNFSCAKSAVDLSSLPRVRLVHPELASLPRVHAHPQQLRQCSLGCQQNEKNGECLKSEGAHDHMDPSLDMLFHHGPTKDSTQTREHSNEIADLLLQLFHNFMDAATHTLLPKIDLVTLLSMQDATPQQRVELLKALLHVVGQTLILLIIISMLWRIGAAVLNVVEVLLWPFAVPFKILRWLVGT